MNTLARGDAPLPLAAERGYLLRYARSRLRDAAAAEDAVQETLLAAWQALARFDRRASLRTWLTGILAHKIADVVREQRRATGSAAAPTAAAATPADETAGDDEPADWRDPERVLAARQAAAALAARLDGLDPLAQRVFELREIEGLDNGEAARALGLSPARGALLWHRTRHRLRDALHRARVL